MAEAGRHGKICVCLTEIDEPILINCPVSYRSAIKQMLSSPSEMLRVTRGGTMSVDSAEAGLITGLARKVRLDNRALRLLTYDVDTE